MARYLTPQRLAILVLVREYLAGRFGLKTCLQLLGFIAEHTDHRDDHDGLAGDTSLSRIGADITVLLQPLTKIASAVPGRSVYDVMLQALWNLDSIDALHEVFEKLAHEVIVGADGAETKSAALRPSRASPLGQYCRRCWVEFTRLPFADTQDLWKSYSHWREPSFPIWSQRNPGAAASYLELAGTDCQTPSAGSEVSVDATSTADINTLITRSIHHLQKLGTRPPEAMKAKLRTWMTNQHDADVHSLQHFMAFFDYWKGGQYTMALESLHRYFDYSLASRAGSSGGNDNMRVYYQYALLHLSVLHADFDCWEESVDAMNECIATARENHDTVCLNFAHSWLLYLRQAKPQTGRSDYRSASGSLGGGAGEQDEITFLKAKAKETKHWSLLSSTLLEQAKHDMHMSGITVPSTEHIAQASFVTMQHDLRNLMPAVHLFESAAFERLGQSHLADMGHHAIAHVHGEQAPLADRVRSVCRTSYNAAQNGQYDSANEALLELLPKVEGVLKLEQRITGFLTLVQLTKSLAMGQLDSSKYYLAQLHPLKALGDPEIDFEILLLTVQLDMQSLELETAMGKVTASLQDTKNKPNNDVSHRLHLMLLKSKISAAAGCPAKGFSVALRVASTAMSCRLLSPMLDAVVVLAGIMNELGEFKAAGELVGSALPKIIEANTTRLLAQAFVTQGDSHVGSAGLSDGTERHQLLRKADEVFGRAYDAYAHLHDLEGSLNSLVRRSTLARYGGDEVAVEHWESVFAQTIAGSKCEPVG